jgi:quercetin dioxygenase-like cupin family protein
LLLEQDGKPAATLRAGQTFLVPAGTVHNATNSGSSTARVVATYVVEKGKPLATPVK